MCTLWAQKKIKIDPSCNLVCIFGIAHILDFYMFDT